MNKFTEGQFWFVTKVTDKYIELASGDEIGFKCRVKVPATGLEFVEWQSGFPKIFEVKNE